MPLTTEQAIEIALAHQQAGRLAEAEGIYRQILRENPRHPVAWVNLGAVLVAEEKFDEAIDAFRTATRVRPDLIEAHYNLGLMLNTQDRLAEAIEAFGAVLRLNPNHADAYGNLGVVFFKLARYDDAVAVLTRAIELRPDFAEAYSYLGYCVFQLHEVERAIAILRRAVELRPDLDIPYRSLLPALNYADEADADPRRVFEEHVNWGRRQVRWEKVPGAGAVREQDAERRLRIGYVSPDFRGHSVSYFFQPILEAHDPGAVETFCYSNVPEKKVDQTTRRIAESAHHWREIRAMSDEKVAEAVSADGIDILVDLAGHTPDNRLSTFALRPAAVQVTYLGYPNTTGLAGVDYRLTDALADPPGMTESYYTETLVRLPRTFCCYRPPIEIEGAAVKERGADGLITFGSVHNLAKVTPAMLKTWAAILAATPSSRLVMKTIALAHPNVRRRIVDAFAQNGIAADRLELSGWGSFAEFVETVGRIDIGLDTFPFNGHTNTCHLLWLGVPVVSLAGKMYGSRMGLSILTNVGLAELVATTREQYVAVACALARDRERVRELRRTLRERMRASPLMDHATFTRNLESAYREMWRVWCAK